ncbi:hypothetical protein GWK47_028587 [Chionoecetes opilio]|uniref:HTH CENPB-type domain-containing protein n=1 Tax=Chionoecetes opilio TaxID=41210 RepID=A0A8J4Z4U1_CHIOP|nr:hypothetical protein GWK47_028587 [Chionoecetes opilio]
MSSKRSTPPTPGSSEKKRKVLSLAEKMDVLAVIDSGLGWSATGKKFGLHEATVSWISEQVDQRKSNVDGVAIREKARSIYDTLAEKEPSGSSLPPGFCQPWWFHRFKQRFSCTTLLAQERSIKFKRVVDEGLIPYKETLRSMEASACQKAHHSFLQTISSQHTSQEAFYTCYTSCYYTSQAACYSCYTR